MKKLGFTLVELLVVLTVIGLLLSIVVPNYVGKTRTAEEAALRQNLTLMRDALDKHFADVGAYPRSLDELVSKLDKPRMVWLMVPQNNPWLIVPPADPQKGGVYDVHSSAKGYESW